MTSEWDADESAVREIYESCACGYVTKPVDPTEFIDTVREITRFWLSTVRLPTDTDRE